MNGENPGSKSNLRSQTKAFFLFCKFYDLQAIAISTEYICLYAQFLARSFKTIGAIKAYIQAVRHLHVLAGADLSGLQSPQLGLTLRGIARLINTPPTQAYPLMPRILTEIRRLLNFNSVLDVVFWSVLLTHHGPTRSPASSPESPARPVARSRVSAGLPGSQHAYNPHFPGTSGH